MTTHETDRPSDFDSVEENEDVDDNDALVADQHDLEADTDTDAATVEDETDATWRDDQDDTDDESDEPELLDSDDDVDTDDEADEPELLDSDDDVDPEADTDDEADESVLLTETAPGSVLPPDDEVTDEPEATEAAAIADAPETRPLQRLEPVGPDTPVDPGTGSYQDRWSAIQAGFIDDPRRAVESASALVAEMWGEIERSIADERQGVDGGWQDSERSTDDLRVAMQNYRAFYARFTSFRST